MVIADRGDIAAHVRKHCGCGRAPRGSRTLNLTTAVPGVALCTRSHTVASYAQRAPQLPGPTRTACRAARADQGDERLERGHASVVVEHDEVGLVDGPVEAVFDPRADQRRRRESLKNANKAEGKRRELVRTMDRKHQFASNKASLQATRTCGWVGARVGWCTRGTREKRRKINGEVGAPAPPVGPRWPWWQPPRAAAHSPRRWWRQSWLPR